MDFTRDEGWSKLRAANLQHDHCELENVSFIDKVANHHLFENVITVIIFFIEETFMNWMIRMVHNDSSNVLKVDKIHFEI